MVVPGFENGVIGMKKGENKTISISPEEAYGEHSAEQVSVYANHPLAGKELTFGLELVELA